MSKFKFELDHIGIAVSELDGGGEFYKALGLNENSREEVTSEKVKTSFFPLGNRVNIELLEGTNPESPIAKYLDKRGPGIHHICLRVQHLDELVAQLKEKNVQLINEVPKDGAHHCRVVFIHPKATGGVLIELSEKKGS
ncbi:MAG: methylmalonyl-CoA epimerase [Bdellovibrionaceae bacterium]|nr:methylmalonyl-CoA epimerase [Pseudobdellovibrionaceae bacterium]